MLRVAVSAQRPVPLDARFEVAAGELLALVGPSGSGKSTLLRAIAGLWRPPQGRIEVGGACWLDAAAGLHRPAHQRRVGMVFQSWALFPHLDALGNVAAAMPGVPAAERRRRAAALLAQVNLQGLESRRPSQLSGGQQQRVALARALAREPDALLLDEPFSAVDRATRERLYRELAELRRRLTMPTVLVTHDLDEAVRLADRMVVVHHGRSLQDGTPTAVMTRPASPTVARLVGLRNVFTGTVDGGRLDWNGRLLELAAGRGGDDGPRAWCVPDGFIVLHRRDRPSRGEHENPVPGRVAARLDMGPTAHLDLVPDHATDAVLRFSVPVHVARRNGLEPGAAATVSLLAEGLHLMDAGGAPAEGRLAGAGPGMEASRDG